MKEIEFITTTREEFAKQYPNLSKEDLDFYFQREKHGISNGIIGHNKYNSLIEKRSQYNNYNLSNPNKEQKKLTELEETQIAKFEEIHKKQNNSSIKKAIEYADSLHDPKKEIIFNSGIEPVKKVIWKSFLTAYSFLNQIEFEQIEESLKNIEPIIKYFSYDKSFFECENLVKEIDGKKLEPSFRKGLLLVGNVGNGKTSAIKAIEFLVKHYFDKSIKELWDTSGDWNRLRFSFKTTESLVSEFEYLNIQELKDQFFSNYSKGNIFFDDLKKEKKASNYGITNVMAEILQKRYNNFKNYTGNNKKFVTHASMNYHKDYPNDVDLALQECGVIYGEHIYDRMFEMFNIVEFKGASKRK